MSSDGVAGAPAPLTDAQAEALIEASDGHWKEDVFCIGGPELMALLRAAAGVDPVQAPSGLTDQLQRAAEASDAGHDPLCMAVLRGKECTCGVDSVQAPSAKLADLRGVLRPDQVYRQQCPDGVRCLNGCHTSEPCWHEQQQAKRARGVDSVDGAKHG